MAIETPRGLLTACLRATGRQVYPINPMAVARYRDRHSHRGPQIRPRQRGHAGRRPAAAKRTRRTGSAPPRPRASIGSGRESGGRTGRREAS